MSFLKLNRKSYRPTTRFFKYLIYNTPIYKSKELVDYTLEAKVNFILKIFDISLKLSQRNKEDSYLRNSIRKNIKNRYKLKLLLVLRLNIFKSYFKKNRNLLRALEGKSFNLKTRTFILTIL